MGKMTHSLTFRKGTPKQLKEYLDQAAEIKAAFTEGLQDVQILQDPDNPKRAEIFTVWRDIAAIKNYRAGKRGGILSGAQVIATDSLEAAVDSTSLRTTDLT